MKIKITRFGTEGRRYGATRARTRRFEQGLLGWAAPAVHPAAVVLELRGPGGNTRREEEEWVIGQIHPPKPPQTPPKNNLPH